MIPILLFGAGARGEKIFEALFRFENNLVSLRIGILGPSDLADYQRFLVPPVPECEREKRDRDVRREDAIPKVFHVHPR